MQTCGFCSQFKIIYHKIQLVKQKLQYKVAKKENRVKMNKIFTINISIGWSHLRTAQTLSGGTAADIYSHTKGAFTPKAKLFFRATESHEKSTHRSVWLR